ncbi:MAG: hypothetical protein ACLSV2_01180 [Clostridium sp.]
MKHKRDLDELMYLLGQENAIEELKSSTESHEFSEEYKNKKKEMLKNLDYMKNRGQEDSIQIYNKKGKKIMKKKIIVLIAAVTATLAISITAYGAVRQYLVTSSKDEETGTLTYEVKTDVKQTKVPAMKVVPGYIPEGYIETKNAPGKYHPNGDLSVGGISIQPPFYTDSFKDIYVSDVEETNIGGVKSQILTREGVEYNHIINMFYEEDGYVVKIYGANNTSLEELKKVAENIKCEVIPGEFIDLEENEISVGTGIEYVEPSITRDHIVNIGEEMTDEGFSDKNPTFTVNSIKILDKLPELNKEGFSDYNEYLASINKDGTLKDYERINEQKWEDNKLNTITETVGMKFVDVTLTIKNPFNKELKDVNIYPRMYSLIKSSDDTLQKEYSYGGCKLQIDGAPFYFDQSDYEGRHFFFSDFAPNETKETHLIYAVDEDKIDDAYINFEQSGTSSFVGSYIKVTK